MMLEKRTAIVRKVDSEIFVNFYLNGKLLLTKKYKSKEDAKHDAETWETVV